MMGTVVVPILCKFSCPRIFFNAAFFIGYVNVAPVPRPDVDNVFYIVLIDALHGSEHMTR
eukprot:SAG11_NODE_3740_length_2255_cov_2.157236_2_plen_60_part_00